MVVLNAADLYGGGSEVSLFFLHGSCRSCGAPGVALRTQVSIDLRGSPGAMAGASLVRTGAEVSRSHLAVLMAFPCPSLPLGVVPA